jgi:hypothetical protein
MQASIPQPVDPATLAAVQAAETAFRTQPVQVYGNTIVNRGSYGSGAMIHFGADGNPEQARIAPLYVFANSILIQSDRTSQGGGGIYAIGIIDRAGNASPSDEPLPNVDAAFFNNVVTLESESPGVAPSFLTLTRAQHREALTLRLSGNWIDEKLLDSAESGFPEPANVIGSGTEVFYSGALLDDRTGAPLGNELSAQALPAPDFAPGALSAEWEFQVEQGRIAPRPADGALDIGAREAVDPLRVFRDGFDRGTLE